MKIFTKEWFKAAGIRALRTFAQAAIAQNTVETEVTIYDKPPDEKEE